MNLEEQEEEEEDVPLSRFSGSFSTPKVDVAIDMGNPFLNVAVDGFLKIGAVSTDSGSLLPFHFLALLLFD